MRPTRSEVREVVSDDKDKRMAKALRILESGNPIVEYPDGGTWDVPSETKPGKFHRVAQFSTTSFFDCDCQDAAYRHPGECKHIFAVKEHLARKEKQQQQQPQPQPQQPPQAAAATAVTRLECESREELWARYDEAV
jgi:hypothetical protein